MQHGVRIEAVFASLQQGEHMVESTCILHTSSHPDKYNNSVNRIISKEEEREDPRRDSSIYLRVQCFHTQSIDSKLIKQLGNH